MVQTDGQNQENSAIKNTINDRDHDTTEYRGNGLDQNHSNPNDAECTQEWTKFVASGPLTIPRKRQS